MSTLPDTTLQRADLRLDPEWIIPIQPAGLTLQQHSVLIRDGRIVALLPRADAETLWRADVVQALPGQLLIGAEHSARDEAKLASEGVTAIVNCAGMICANHFPHRFHYLKLNLLDTAREDISAVFYDVLDFIDGTIEQEHGTVFVHCQHGVSRSATLVIAYIMWKRGLAYDDALELVRAARPTVNPNIGFACALLQWGASIEAPPQTTQAWALGTALGSGALLGDLAGDMTGILCGTSAAAAAAVASGSAAPASASVVVGRAQRSSAAHTVPMLSLSSSYLFFEIPW
jgi:protein-tyrosine phosphatase